MNAKLFRVGQEVTLVSKGIRHSPYVSDWVDEEVKGETSFFKITKIGKKYLYGKYYHYNEETGEKVREECNWEASVNMEEYWILIGEHEEYKIKYQQFRKALDDWRKTQQEKQRDFDRELSKQLRAKMDEWDKQNPIPKNMVEETLRQTINTQITLS